MALKSALDPLHIGEYLKDIQQELELTVKDMADNLQVSRNHMTNLLNGRASLTPEMAIKVSKAFGSSPELWMRLQMKYDLWKAKQTVETKGIKSLRPQVQ